MKDSILPKDVYHLEYNPSQRAFHYNNGTNSRNTYGWATLKTLSESDCNDFCNFMEKKYVDGRQTGILPELKIVQLELDLFLELKNHRRKLAGRI